MSDSTLDGWKCQPICVQGRGCPITTLWRRERSRRLWRGVMDKKTREDELADDNLLFMTGDGSSGAAGRKRRATDGDRRFD